MPLNYHASSIAAISIATAALACSAPRVGAQTPVHWTATAPSGSVPVGGRVNIKLQATIADGWHIYAINQGPGGPIPTRITLAPDQPFTLADVVSTTSAPRTELDQSFGIKVMMHEKSAAFTVPVRISPAVRSGIDSVHVNARYQVCNATLCLPPQTARLTAALRTRAGK
ncbi:MAG: protein-disulfide reductase DsbD N-terminal domain-containing protein [Gemmatimonadaceae bacterium]